MRSGGAGGGGGDGVLHLSFERLRGEAWLPKVSKCEQGGKEGQGSTFGHFVIR